MLTKIMLTCLILGFVFTATGKTLNDLKVNENLSMTMGAIGLFLWAALIVLTLIKIWV